MKSHALLFSLSFVFLAPTHRLVAEGVPPYNPHPGIMADPRFKKIYETAGDPYRVDYRPQFHFSPKTEWMNDINALWYVNGTYHMIYQWGLSQRHGGYATSQDLLHWEDKGVALIGQQSFLPKDAPRAFSGDQIYSGSGVVVSGATAKKITGSEKETMVTLYTGTNVGTCIAWSNDNGATWNNYTGNPVANKSENGSRDPCVIWYEPEQKWVMVIFGPGNRFFESKDLITWTELSKIDFGFECPDLVCLPLDGDPKNTKWVLYDAQGSYLVGQFNGKEFVREQEALKMDVGPDFYAGQTFYPQNMPNPGEYIQLAWMDHWNGGVGERGYQRNATFPVQLGLITHHGRMRLTRTPIKAIEKLHADGATWNDVLLKDSAKQGNDLLCGVEGKTFDIQAVFDISKLKGGEIIFQLNNMSLRYDLAKQQLLAPRFDRWKSMVEDAYDLKPDSNGRLEIRILLDHSTLEIFGEKNTFSYSLQYGFLPEDRRIGLRSLGADVPVIELKYHRVTGIWK